MRREINLNQINGQVVDVAMKVLTAQGPELLENTYPEDETQLLYELKTTGMETGLLINFGA